MPMQNIYFFDEGNKDQKQLLGGKGANLAEMTNLGLPVPQGFTISTEVCDFYLSNQNSYPDTFSQELEKNLSRLESEAGKIFGDAENPLLVSVRSGAAVSMPGMMDTILNLGLNDQTIIGLINKTQNPRFAYDSYRRFVNMFGNVVLGIHHEAFDEQMEAIKSARGVVLDTQLTENDLRELVGLYKGVVLKETGKPFPENPADQLKLAIEAVFNSWNNDRANTYRRIHGIHGLKGTAVTVQSMVFGNMGETSGTGVLFSRNPSTGEKVLYGEFLMNAQGEDVVAGIRTPETIEALRRELPALYDQLVDIKDKLELHYKDMQDIEFTVEEAKLYFLQTRNGKRTAQAAVKIATDLVREGLLTKEEALLKIDASSLNQLLHPRLDDNAAKLVVAVGLPASPGAAVGKVVFSADDAVNLKAAGENVILVRKETSPEDIHGMHAANGILTSTGGMTSHAAVVARGMGKCCIAGCTEILVDKKHRKILTKSGQEIHEGDIITLNGSTGEVILGALQMVEPQVSGDFQEILEWTNEFKKLQVRSNADTVEDARKSLEFGAEGIGLCRTEHMFFEDERIAVMREMILAQNLEGRARALAKLMPMQKQDFKQIFAVMDGKPVTIRLLDPPLHEFLPYYDKKVAELAETMNIDFETLKNTIESLHEVNPMLGHRGCRLAITYPEIYQMQTQAIIEAAIECVAAGIKVHPEIEIPLVGNVKELSILRAEVQEVLDEYKNAINFEIKIGTMIEVPRACLTADEIATEADFFSFGTNDLTQTTYGLSRDDASKFIPAYIERGIMLVDPAESIDQAGVGALMKIAVEKGRTTTPNLEIGICGEHGGEPRSVEFCHNIGLDYVSCSPYRVPIARLAAAQAAIKAARA
jgi:pyruvate,orthophosphate dikinase